MKATTMTRTAMAMMAGFAILVLFKGEYVPIAIITAVGFWTSAILMAVGIAKHRKGNEQENEKG